GVIRGGRGGLEMAHRIHASVYLCAALAALVLNGCWRFHEREERRGHGSMSGGCMCGRGTCQHPGPGGGAPSPAPTPTPPPAPDAGTTPTASPPSPAPAPSPGVPQPTSPCTSDADC